MIVDNYIVLSYGHGSYDDVNLFNTMNLASREKFVFVVVVEIVFF